MILEWSRSFQLIFLIFSTKLSLLISSLCMKFIHKTRISLSKLQWGLCAGWSEIPVKPSWFNPTTVGLLLISQKYLIFYRSYTFMQHSRNCPCLLFSIILKVWQGVKVYRQNPLQKNATKILIIFDFWIYCWARDQKSQKI